MAVEFTTNQEIIEAAHSNVPAEVWDYLVGGSESETTMRRNRLGFDQLAFRPRMLVDVSNIDPSTTFLGHPLRIPVMTAPIGSLQEFTPDGGMAAAIACAEFGTVPFVGAMVQPSLEEIAESTTGPKIFQLYLRGDLEWCRETIDRAVAAGYSALCVTVDSAVAARRERQIRHGYAPPSHRRDPEGRARQAVLDWKMLDSINAMSDLPLIVKGVGTAEDARLAVDHGAEIVYVSNHGGRALDHCRATIEILPEVVAAAGDRVPIVLDGGVTRATDVLKALALGAEAVTIGKLQGWGLAADGSAGLRRVFEILEQELVINLGLLGVTKIADVRVDHVCPTYPVTLPHEFSAFPHMADLNPSTKIDA